MNAALVAFPSLTNTHRAPGDAKLRQKFVLVCPAGFVPNTWAKVLLLRCLGLFVAWLPAAVLKVVVGEGRGAAAHEGTPCNVNDVFKRVRCDVYPAFQGPAALAAVMADISQVSAAAEAAAPEGLKPVVRVATSVCRAYFSV